MFELIIGAVLTLIASMLTRYVDEDLLDRKERREAEKRVKAAAMLVEYEFHIIQRKLRRYWERVAELRQHPHHTRMLIGEKYEDLRAAATVKLPEWSEIEWEANKGILAINLPSEVFAPLYRFYSTLQEIRRVHGLAATLEQKYQGYAEERRAELRAAWERAREGQYLGNPPASGQEDWQTAARRAYGSDPSPMYEELRSMVETAIGLSWPVQPPPAPPVAASADTPP